MKTVKRYKAAVVLLVLSGSTLSGQTRDAFQWPFSQDSIWNMPIGSNAIYHRPTNSFNADAAVGTNFAWDQSYYEDAPPGSPWVTFKESGWKGGLCSGRTVVGKACVSPSTVILSINPNGGKTPNNVSSIRQPDGRTLFQNQPTCRDTAGGGFWGSRCTEIDIYGKGEYGPHYSGLPSHGSLLKPGELSSSDPITHALSLEVSGGGYLHSQAGPNRGYRWPAYKVDNGGGATWGGTDPKLKYGSLMAIPPGVTLQSLGLETVAGIKLYYAFLDYGGYIVDDSAGAFSIVAHKDIYNEVQSEYGMAAKDDGPLRRDLRKLWSNLHVVDNNSPTSIGGGGTPRVALAPPFSVTPPPPPTPLSRAGWTATTTSGIAAGSSLAAMFDGSTGTFWKSTTTGQSHGDVVIDFGAPKTFNRLKFDTKDSNFYNFCWRYTISVSDNGSTWTMLAIGSGYPETQLTFPRQTKRYVKIRGQGMCICQLDNRGLAWAIEEINAFDIAAYPN